MNIAVIVSFLPFLSNAMLSGGVEEGFISESLPFELDAVIDLPQCHFVVELVLQEKAHSFEELKQRMEGMQQLVCQYASTARKLSRLARLNLTRDEVNAMDAYRHCQYLAALAQSKYQQLATAVAEFKDVPN